MDLLAREKAISMRKLHSKLAMYYIIRGTKLIIVQLKCPGTSPSLAAAWTALLLECGALQTAWMKRAPRETCGSLTLLVRETLLLLSAWKNCNTPHCPLEITGQLPRLPHEAAELPQYRLQISSSIPWDLVPESTTVCKTLLIKFLLSTSVKPAGTN